MLAAKKAEGLSGAAYDALVAEMAQMTKNYANPLFRMPMTFIEIFPVGLLVALVSAALLRNPSSCRPGLELRHPHRHPRPAGQRHGRPVGVVQEVGVLLGHDERARRPA
jgi:hypothetical protein